jgi:ABC-type sugar transport system ATPase subunit
MKTVATRDRVFALVRALAADGVATVFITHRMDEIALIGNRISVMRSGVTVGTLAAGEWTTPQVVRLMTGSDSISRGARRVEDAAPAPAGRRDGGVLVRARGLVLRSGHAALDFEARAGELVGVAGLEGHGQDELLEALRGARIVAGEVLAVEDGREAALRSPSAATAHGIAYVPRERAASLFRWMSISENFAMPTLGRDTRAGWLRPAASRRRFAEYAKRLNVVFGDDGDPITTLSGGNQQKVVIARWLAAGPRVLLLNDPTRGIDIGAKHDLYRLLLAMAAQGLAVVMLSTELEEHVELMDRVLVFREHELFREIPRADLRADALVSAFFGQGEGA